MHSIKIEEFCDIYLLEMFSLKNGVISEFEHLLMLSDPILCMHFKKEINQTVGTMHPVKGPL